MNRNNYFVAVSVFLIALNVILMPTIFEIDNDQNYNMIELKFDHT